MNNTSSINTMLIVILLLVVVGVAVWFFTRGGAPAEELGNSDFNINVDLPDNNGQSGQNGGQAPAPAPQGY